MRRQKRRACAGQNEIPSVVIVRNTALATYICVSVCLSVCMSDYLYLMFFSLLALLSYPCLCRVGLSFTVSFNGFQFCFPFVCCSVCSVTVLTW